MARKDRIVRPGVLALALAGLVGGCSRAPELPKGNAQVKPSYNAKTGRLERITYDRNHDGKVDAWTFMDGTRLVRAELDENDDGVVDRWEHYGEGAGSDAPTGVKAAGELSRVEIATRRDGKVSRREFYERGRRTRAEEDTDGDGRVDKWETWADGALATILLDTDTDGRPDRRLVYASDGSAPRFDTVGADGTFPPAP
jgi:hypothetical protein